jgi:hypothetical protein
MIAVRLLLKAFFKIFGGIALIVAFVCITPFINLKAVNYESICKDAAKIYSIEEDEYVLTFKKGKISFAKELVSGTLDIDEEEMYEIVIETNYSRPMTIATIFHEFAHAAQDKYNLDLRGYNIEQHAEILAFQTMWRSKYWYNALHVLEMHSFKLMPRDYLCPTPIWKAAISGLEVV